MPCLKAGGVDGPQGGWCWRPRCNHSDPSQLPLQRKDEVLGQHRHPVLAALALADDDLTPLELDILDAQPQAFEQAHAGAVQQGRDQPRGASHLVQQGAHFGGREHHRKPRLLVRGHHLVEPRQLHNENGPVEKQHHGLGLILRGRRYAPVGGQMGQESRHLRSAHLGRMALLIKQDEAPRPIHIS